MAIPDRFHPHRARGQSLGVAQFRSLPLALSGWEHPSPAAKVDVTCLESEDLLGPEAGLPAYDVQILVPDLGSV